MARSLIGKTFALSASVCLVFGQTPGKASPISPADEVGRSFYAALSCRNAKLSMGPQGSGAFVFDQLNGKLSIQPFGVRTSSNATEIIPSQTVEIPRWGDSQQLFWSPEGRIVLLKGHSVAWGTLPSAIPRAPIQLTELSLMKFMPLTQFDGDVYPTRIRRLFLARTGSAGELLQVNAVAPAISRTGLFLTNSPLISDGDGNVLRQLPQSDGSRLGFEYFDRKATGGRNFRLPLCLQMQSPCCCVEIRVVRLKW